MRITLLALVISLGISMGASAQNTAPTLGRFQIGAELDAMSMQHRTFETDDGGIFLGLSVFGHVRNGWYLGAEIGVGGSMKIFGYEDSSFVPIEVNAKRAFRLANHLAADLGAGLSYGQVEFSHSLFVDDPVEINEWVPGAQVFGGLLVDAGPFFVGIKLKYQLTMDAEEIADFISPDDGWDYSNLRIGAQVGFLLPD